MRHVIIGNSIAAIKAVEAIRSVDRKAPITIIADEHGPAYSRCLLPDYLAGTRSEADLSIRSRDFYRQMGVELVLGRAVTKVVPADREVELAGGLRYGYDRLLIATGSSTFMPPIPGLGGNGVFGLRSLGDAKAIQSALPGARRAVVVGAGLVGLEAAYALYRRGLEVTVVEKMPQILPQQFDRRAAHILRQDMETEGIRFILGCGIQEVAGPSLWSRVMGKAGQGVFLEGGERLKAELVVVATGAVPNVGLVQDTGIKVNRGIVVDRFMQTSIPGIYAAGDVAETRDAVTGLYGLSPIWPNAAAQGRIAGLNMAGVQREYSSMVGMQNAVEFREVPAIAVGIVNTPGDDYEVFADYRPDKNYYRKLVMKNDVLVGMILVGDIRSAGVLSGLIKKKANVRTFKHLLRRPDFGYGHLLVKLA